MYSKCTATHFNCAPTFIYLQTSNHLAKGKEGSCKSNFPECIFTNQLSNLKKKKQTKKTKDYFKVSSDRMSFGMSSRGDLQCRMPPAISQAGNCEMYLFNSYL